MIYPVVMGCHRGCVDPSTPQPKHKNGEDVANCDDNAIQQTVRYWYEYDWNEEEEEDGKHMVGIPTLDTTKTSHCLVALDASTTTKLP